MNMMMKTIITFLYTVTEKSGLITGRGSNHEIQKTKLLMIKVK